MNVLLYDNVEKEVNSYINRVDDITLFDIAKRVYELDWEYYNIRNIVRVEGSDLHRSTATQRFYKMYNKSTPQDIVGIYNYMHKTEYEVDLTNNIVKPKNQNN